MTYSRSTRSVERVRQILDDMLLIDGERAWPSKNAVQLAYHLREAMTAASHILEFRQYAGLKERFIVRVRNNEVVIEPRIKSAYEGVKYASSKLSLEDVTEVTEAIGAATKHKVEELHLPNFVNDEEELAKLFRWTELNSLHIISHYGAGITLSRRHPGDLKWIPS